MGCSPLQNDQFCPVIISTAKSPNKGHSPNVYADDEEPTYL